MFKWAIVVLLFSTTVYSAPRPSLKPAKEKSVTPGNYKMTWGYGDWDITLSANGLYTANGGWEGGYSWSDKTRTFAVSESCDGGTTYLVWHVKMDGTLKGEGQMSSGGTIKVSLEPSK